MKAVAVVLVYRCVARAYACTPLHGHGFWVPSLSVPNEILGFE